MLLLLLTDLSRRAGLDPDASLTVERALGLLGQLEQLSVAVTAPAGPWTPDAHGMRIELRAALKRMAPLMSRVVLAQQAMEG